MNRQPLNNILIHNVTKPTALQTSSYITLTIWLTIEDLNDNDIDPHTNNNTWYLKCDHVGASRTQYTFKNKTFIKKHT